MVTKKGQEVSRWLLGSLSLSSQQGQSLGSGLQLEQGFVPFLQMTTGFLEKFTTQPTTNSPTLCLAGQRGHDSPCGLCE